MKLTLREFDRMLLPGNCDIEIYEWPKNSNPSLKVSIPAFKNIGIIKFAKSYLDYNLFEVRVETNLIKLYITRETI